MYRDTHLACPRCAGPLVDAVVGVACPSCRGLWISPADLEEMVAAMQTPAIPVDILVAFDTGRAPLPCPACRLPMTLLALHHVPIDACFRHGVWFDAEELAVVLMRSARKPVA